MGATVSSNVAVMKLILSSGDFDNAWNNIVTRFIFALRGR